MALELVQLSLWFDASLTCVCGTGIFAVADTELKEKGTRAGHEVMAPQSCGDEGCCCGCSKVLVMP